MKRLLLAALLLLDVLTVTVALLSQCPPEKLPQGKYGRSIQGLYKTNSTAPLEVVFLHTESVFPGTIGYYIYNSTTNRTEQETDLFPDVNCARVGDTLTIGPFPSGTSLGFYIVAHQNSTPENSNPDNITHGALAYIAQEFIVRFDGGGDTDFRVLLMIRPADNESQATSICVKTDTIPGSVECYETANLIFGVAALFLGFAVTAFEGLKKKKRTSERVLLVLATLAFLGALTTCFAYRIAASSDVNKVSCEMTVGSGVVTGVGIILYLIAKLISDTERVRHENGPTYEIVELLPKKPHKKK